MPKAPDLLAGLSPLVRQIVSLVGRRAGDAELLAYFAKIGAKVPATKMDASSGKNVVAKKHGLEFVFHHDVKHALYPLVPKTKSTFIPYLSHLWLTDKFPEPRPFGYERGLAPDEMTKRLGVTPTVRGSGKYCQPYWSGVLDAKRAVMFGADIAEFTITINEARELFGRYGMPARVVAGLFVAWAAQRDLLDPTRVGSHASLLEDIRAGKRKGSELLSAAWPRGLWDIHLVDKPGLRDFAFQWFHNIQVGYIRDDLVAVFGGREGSHGHEEPVLDDDDAKAVKKATRKLDAVFAPWLK
jgi:hypothetical protein